MHSACDSFGVSIAGGTNNIVGRSNNFSDSGTNNLTNQGILQATAANMTLNINNSGLFTNAAINLSATATVAAAGTLDLQAFGGNLTLVGGRILGGTLTSNGTARLTANSDLSNRLDGVMRTKVLAVPM